MKWLRYIDEVGTRRKINKFLFFPMTLRVYSYAKEEYNYYGEQKTIKIYNVETRWLENVTILQEVVNFGCTGGKQWLNVEFVDGDENNDKC